MKKKRSLLTFIILFTVLLAGCGTEAPREKELDTGILFRDGWTSFCVYSDDAQMLLAVEGQVNEKDLFKFNGGFETRAYVLYDLKQEKIKKLFPVDMEALSYSAIPYKDGLIYVKYTNLEDVFEWEVLYLTENGEKNLFSGTCKDFLLLPSLTLLNEVPVSLWINDKEGTSGMNTMSDLEVKTVVKKDTNWLMNTTIATNYDEICFAVRGDSKYAELVVANEAGIVSQVRMDGKINAYALTKDYILCGLRDWEETGKCHILRYDFKADEKENFSTQGELYRMCGGTKNDALCVDMHFNIYRIDGDAGRLEKINGVFGFANMPVVFRPIFDNQVICAYLKDDIYSYYLLRLE